MDLPNIDPERMKAASEALEKVIKEGGTHEAARAEFERVIKGEAVTAVEDDAPFAPQPPEPETCKPARKTRADKGQPRKKAPPKPAELAAAGEPKDTAGPSNIADRREVAVGRLVIALAKELLS